MSDKIGCVPSFYSVWEGGEDNVRGRKTGLRAMKEQEMRGKLIGALVECGIPKSSIILDAKVRVSQHCVERADLIIAAENRRTTVALFEFERHECDCVPRKLSTAIKNFPCYFVCQGEGGGLQVAKMTEVGETSWVPVSSDADSGFRMLLGCYETESAMAINKQEDEINEAVQRDIMKFRRGICGVGIVSVSMLAFLEVCQIRLSWNVYALMGLLILLYAVSCGVVVNIEARGVRIGLFWRDMNKNGGEK